MTGCVEQCSCAETVLAFMFSYPLCFATSMAAFMIMSFVILVLGGMNIFFLSYYNFRYITFIIFITPRIVNTKRKKRLYNSEQKYIYNMGFIPYNYPQPRELIRLIFQKLSVGLRILPLKHWNESPRGWEERCLFLLICLIPQTLPK